MSSYLESNLSTNQTSQVKVNEFIKISQKELESGHNLNEKLAQAARMGFFYLEMPQDCKLLVGKAVDFANSFYTKSSVKELKLEGFSGYHDRESSQVESLYLERKYWNDQLPAELLELAPKMHELAVEVLKKTLSVCEISKNEDQEKMTGGVSENKGDIYFTFNHYRADKPFEGLASHRDFGQITVLFINKLGLQTEINEKWVDVPPLENHFVVNYGRALEYSVNNVNQLTAALHRVQQVTKDRISFGIFADNTKDSMMHQKTSSNNLFNRETLFSAYIEKCFAEHYEPVE